MQFRNHLLLVVILSTTFLACGEQAPRVWLPESLAGLELTQLDDRGMASRMLSRMHRGVDFSDAESVIGTYGAGDSRAIVYLTQFADEQTSGRMMTAMVHNIKAQKSPEFRYLQEMEREGRTVHVAASTGYTHYFFQDGKRDVWISAPVALAEAVLSDFLNQSKFTY